MTTKKNEEEWVEYQNTMENVIKKSGLDSVFYDLKGNHDNFGVSTIGDSYDFFFQNIASLANWEEVNLLIVLLYRLFSFSSCILSYIYKSISYEGKLVKT